jgi:prepilin-type N-terminal cleavage/methylation domain-containing protein
MDRSRRHPRPGSDAGFTLPELLVATVIGLAIIGSAVSLFTAIADTQPRASDRSEQIQQARFVSERLGRELRQASDATTLPTTCTSGPCPGIAILTYVPSTNCTGDARTGTATAVRCRVFYSCSTAGTCTRTECPPTVADTVAPTAPPCGAPVQVIEGLASDDVFTFSPRTPGHSFIAFALSFAAENGNDAITIEDGSALRNPPLGDS